MTPMLRADDKVTDVPHPIFIGNSRDYSNDFVVDHANKASVWISNLQKLIIIDSNFPFLFGSKLNETGEFLRKSLPDNELFFRCFHQN